MSLCCDDGNNLHDQRVHGGECVYTPTNEGVICDDHNACTGAGAAETATCTGGLCGSLVVACADDGHVCTLDVCQPIDQTCVHPKKPNATVCNPAIPGGCDVAETCDGVGLDCPADAIVPNGTGCTIDACTAGATCSGGHCTGGAALSCDDGLACTTDTCDTVAGCQHAQAAGTCLIGGVCRASGEVNGADACQVCDPATPGAWSARGCDDGLACTTDTCDTVAGCQHAPAAGTCLIGGVCRASGEVNGADACQVCDPATPGAWSARGCDDGLACTTDTCDSAAGCQHAPAAGTCLIAGVCRASGEVNGADACQVCDPATPGAWSARGCDDGLACTTDTCDSVAGCQHAPAAGTCLIGGVCRASGEVNGADACQVCDPATPGAWSARGCDDGLACTADTCDSVAGCQHAPAAGTCLIAGVCRASGEVNGADACQVCDPATPGAWSARGCDDGLNCTTESCDTSSGCQHESTRAAA